MNLQPFKVQIPQETLDDLQQRLARTRWADEISDAGWDYGSNLSYMKESTDYWQSHFDWRAQEEEINFFSHFRASIDNSRKTSAVLRVNGQSALAMYSGGRRCRAEVTLLRWRSRNYLLKIRALFSVH